MEAISVSSTIRNLLFSEACRINNPKFILSDPVQFPRKFSSIPDIEIVSLLVSTISWGNRKMICRNADRLLQLMEYDPLNWCLNDEYEHLPDTLNIHRTFFAKNLKYYMRGLKWIYSHFSTLEEFAIKNDVISTEVPAYHLALVLNRLLMHSNHGVADNRCLPTNLESTPLKRLNMALRWMVRDDCIVDIGIWKSIKPSQLLIPLDVHSAETSRKFGFITRKSTDKKALFQLMNTLRPLNPKDPALFDFALFGLGMGL